MKLIVGLGNPGEKYKNTRHNIGFRVLDKICDEADSSWKKDSKMNSYISKIVFEDQDCVLIKPDTFMNNSGQAVSAVANYYNIEIKDIYVIYDDKDIEFSKIRYREKGGSGGHNGIKSIIQYLSSEEFNRIKIGVRNELVDRMDTADFVLSRFSKDEEDQIGNLINNSINILTEII